MTNWRHTMSQNLQKYREALAKELWLDSPLNGTTYVRWEDLSQYQRNEWLEQADKVARI